MNKKLRDYIRKNKEKVYNFANHNTPKNVSGGHIVEINDEWRSETEWDEYFLIPLKNI